VSLRDSGLAPTLDPTIRRMARRQRMGVVNRRLGWTILPLVIVATIVHFGPGQPLPGEPRFTFVLALNMIYAPLTLVHLVLTFYVFGIVRPSRTLRVFHIYFGYAYAVLIVGSNATWPFPTLHGILTGLMFAALAAHVAIGVHYARRRRRSGVRAIRPVSVERVAAGGRAR
jgi:hypothetical protein